MQPKVSIIILNWNGIEDTLECLVSISQINYYNYNIILFDNGSKHHFIEKIINWNKINKKFFINVYEEEIIKNPKIIVKSHRELIIIKGSKNYGFAKGIIKVSNLH